MKKGLGFDLATLVSPHPKLKKFIFSLWRVSACIIYRLFYAHTMIPCSSPTFVPDQLREHRLTDISADLCSTSVICTSGMLFGATSCTDSRLRRKMLHIALNFLTTGRSVAAEEAISDILTSRSDQVMRSGFEYTLFMLERRWIYGILVMVAMQALCGSLVTLYR